MSASADGLREPGGFLAGWCAECRREVLAYPDGEPTADVETCRCIHCDERLSSDLRWVDAEELSGLGYAVDADGPGGGCATCVSGECGAKSGNQKRGIE